MVEVAHPSRSARQAIIVEHLTRVGAASAAELVELTGRSLMTVHRDIDYLAERGILRKYHGGVSSLPSNVFESSAEVRIGQRPAEKDALARAALSLIEPGMSVMLDASSTVLALARRMVEITPLTVLTNYRASIDIFRESPDIEFILFGGKYSLRHDAFLGAPSLTGLDRYSVDIVFESASAVDTRWTYHQEEEVLVLKRAMLDAGSRRVLMIDGSKVGRTALYRSVPITAFTDVILTPDVDKDIVNELREQVNVHFSKPIA